MVDQTDMAERVYEAVEALVESSPLGLRCEYEYLPTKRAELPCLSMQTLGGDPVVRRYLDGGVVLQYPFALVLRQSSEDTRDRLDAPRVLRELSRALCSLGEPEAVATLDLECAPAHHRAHVAASAHPGAARHDRLPGDACRAI